MLISKSTKPKVCNVVDGLLVSCDPFDLFLVFWFNVENCAFAVTDRELWTVACDGSSLMFNGSEFVS